MSFKELVDGLVSKFSEFFSSPEAQNALKNADQKAEKSSNSTKNCYSCKTGQAPLTPQQAQSLHTEMAGQKDIPFNYAPDCCYARAERMSQLMSDKGIPNAKTWAYGNLKPKKESGAPVTAPNGKPIIWGWHVAPIVPVQSQSGEVVDMVIDPSLRNRPLTIPEWEATLGTVSVSAQSDKSVYLRNPSGQYRTQKNAPLFNKLDIAFSRHKRSLRGAGK